MVPFDRQRRAPAGLTVASERITLAQLLYEYAGRAQEGPHPSGPTAIKVQQIEEAFRTSVKPPPGSASMDVYTQIARGAASGFTAGFAIGTGVNRRWLHIGTEFVSEATGAYVPERTMLAPVEAGSGPGMPGGEPSVDRFVWQWTDDAPGPNEVWRYDRSYAQLTGTPCGQIVVPTVWRLSVSLYENQLCIGPPSVFGKPAVAYALPEDLIDEPIRPLEPDDVPARSISELPPDPDLTGNSPTLEEFYENAPDAYRDKLDQALLVTVPVCRGDGYADCKSKLEAVGFTVEQGELDFGAADLDIPADRVASTAPAVQAPAGSNVQVYVNPPAERMPLRVPALSTDETPLAYAARLQAAGLAVEIREASAEVAGGVPGTVQHVAPDDRALPLQKVAIGVDPYGPPTADNEVPECRVSNPTGVDPAPSRGGLASWPNQWESPLARKLAFERYRPLPFTRSNSTGGPTTVFLQWGVVIRDSNDWRGFRYRKLKTKHGWSQEDDAATQKALLVPGTPQGTRFLHIGPTVQMPNGAICFRVVVVQTRSEPGEPAAREIITSYGKLST